MTMITILIPFVIIALLILFVTGVRVQTAEEDGELLTKYMFFSFTSKDA